MLVAAALVDVALGIVAARAGRGAGPGVAAGLGALRGAAVVAMVAACLWVLATALADGGREALRTLDGALAALAPR